MSPFPLGVLVGILFAWGLSLMLVSLLTWYGRRELRAEVIRQARERAAAGVAESAEAASRVLAALAVQRASGRSVYVPKPHELVDLHVGFN